MSKTKKPPKWKMIFDDCYFRVPKAAIRGEIERFVNEQGILEYDNSFDICKYADKLWVQPPNNPSYIDSEKFYVEPDCTSEDISSSVETWEYNSLALSNYVFNNTFLKYTPERFGVYLLLDSPDTKPERDSDSIIYASEGQKYYRRNEAKDAYTFHHFLRAKRLDYLSFIWTLQLLDICEEPIVYAVASKNEEFELLKVGQKLNEMAVYNLCQTTFYPYCFRLKDAKRIAAEDDCAVVKIRHPKYTTSFAEATIEDIILP